MWNQRYAEKGYAYGKEPNKFLEEQLAKIPVEGKALFAAEGEGRNAVHAAKLRWDVTAFDLSESGKMKALLLAEEENVSINYLVENLQNLDFKSNEFDLLVLIYAHFSAALKTEFHKKLHICKFMVKEN